MNAPVRIVAVSDLHGYLPDIPPCDLLLLGGDLCPDGGVQRQSRWLHREFRDWLKSIPAREIVAVAGNHDWIFEKRPDMVPDLPWHYLLDSGADVLGLSIYGSPWQPVFFDWAFNLPEDQLARKWERIPEKLDILLLHGPPHGFGDLAARNIHTGSPSLTRRIRETKPRLVVCGHIHEARGEYRLDDTRIVNVSQVDVRYQPYENVVELSL